MLQGPLLLDVRSLYSFRWNPRIVNPSIASSADASVCSCVSRKLFIRHDNRYGRLLGRGDSCVGASRMLAACSFMLRLFMLHSFTLQPCSHGYHACRMTSMGIPQTPIPLAWAILSILNRAICERCLGQRNCPSGNRIQW
jgi:hypothetical protein